MPPVGPVRAADSGIRVLVYGSTEATPRYGVCPVFRVGDPGSVLGLSKLIELSGDAYRHALVDTKESKIGAFLLSSVE
jgi:hypothetical protein